MVFFLVALDSVLNDNQKWFLFNCSFDQELSHRSTLWSGRGCSTWSTSCSAAPPAAHAHKFPTITSSLPRDLQDQRYAKPVHHSGCSEHALLDITRSGGSKRPSLPLTRGPNSFNFMQFLGKYGKIVCWHPPGRLVPPPRRNPGSATDSGCGEHALWGICRGWNRALVLGEQCN